MTSKAFSANMLAWRDFMTVSLMSWQKMVGSKSIVRKIRTMNLMRVHVPCVVVMQYIQHCQLDQKGWLMRQVLVGRGKKNRQQREIEPSSAKCRHQQAYIQDFIVIKHAHLRMHFCDD
jgi:hypothetical protein